ncbi:MAG: HNH endonuclease [bacterium]
MSLDCLVLNRNYYAVHITDWKRAISLVYCDHAHIVDEDFKLYDFCDWREVSKAISDHPSGYVHTPQFKIAVPEVIVLRYYDKLPASDVKFTRRNIYEHYHYKCCYCGKSFNSSMLNLDHVIPKSRGGRTDWANIVTACFPCNLKKANRTPKEADMMLVIEPTKPKWKQGVSLIMRPRIKIKSSWQKFIDTIYWNSELES